MTAPSSHCETWRLLCRELSDTLAQYVTLPDDPEAVALLRRARAELAQAKPSGLTKEQLDNLVPAYYRGDEFVCYREGLVAGLELAASCSGRHLPVDLEEGWPAPEDCDAEGLCWALRADDGGDGANTWMMASPEWFKGNSRWTHWLPANALFSPQPWMTAANPQD